MMEGTSPISVQIVDSPREAARLASRAAQGRVAVAGAYQRYTAQVQEHASERRTTLLDCRPKVRTRRNGTKMTISNCEFEPSFAKLLRKPKRRKRKPA